MEERNRAISSLKFNGYIVNQVNFIRNEQTKNNSESWELSFEIKNDTKINEEKNKMSISLLLDIFKDVENAPFYMNAKITGFFEMAGEEDITRYEANAIAIMYPYLRAIISTYTASANINPLILPAINVNAMLKNQKN